MSPADKRFLVLVPVALLLGLAWWLWPALTPEHDEPADLARGGAVIVENPTLPPPVPATAVEHESVVALTPPTPGAEAEATTQARRQRPIFAVGRLVSPMPVDFSLLEVELVDREGDEVASAQVAADGGFVVRFSESLGSGWGLSCNSELVDLNGDVRYLLPTFAGPFASHAPTRPPVECTLELVFAPRILGVVTSARNGRVIEGAEVSVGSSHPAWAFDDDYADSDAGGRYELEVRGVPARGVLVWCRAWEHQAALVGPIDLPTSGDLVLNFQLEKARVIKGTVLDLRGQPVEGVEVTLGSSHMPFEDDDDWDFTDEQGRFRLDAEDMPLEGAWIHAGGSDEHGPAILRLAPPVRERLELVLPAPVALIGVVLDSTGQPLGEAEVLVVFSASWFGIDAGVSDEALVDASGAFRVELASAVPEESRLIVQAPGYLPFDGPLIDVATYEGSEQAYRVEIRLEAEDEP